MASVHEKLQSKAYYAARILPQVRGAVESGIPLEDLDIPLEYRSQAARDYESSGMSMPENAFREAKEMVTGLPEMAKVVGKGVAKAALPIDFFPEDPGLDELAKEIAAGTVDEIGSVFTDPERVRVAPLATAGALLGPLAPGKFLKIKKVKPKQLEMPLGDARGRTQGQPELEIEKSEKGRRVNDTFVDDSGSSVTPDDMDAAAPASPATAGRYSPTRKPKSPDFDTDRRVPGQDPDDVLDIGETPNYPSKETMDVENLSPSDAEAMSIYQELARENYAEGGSQKSGMFAASRKNNLPDPGAPKGPQGTAVTPPTWQERLGGMFRKDKPAQPAAQPEAKWEDVDMEDSGEFLTIEEPTDIRGARSAPAQAIEDIAVPPPAAAPIDLVHSQLQKEVGDIARQVPQTLEERARAETIDLVRRRRLAGKAAGEGLADQIYQERLLALRAEEAAQRALDAKIAADQARRAEAEDKFHSGQTKRSIRVPDSGPLDEDVMERVGRLVDDEQQARDLAGYEDIYQAHERDAGRLAKLQPSADMFETPDLESVQAAGYRPILGATQAVKPQIGTGAFGRVYSVTSRKDPKVRYAAKVQSMDDALREADVRKLITEAEASDPSIAGIAPRLIEMVEDPKHQRGVIVMEQLDPLRPDEKKTLAKYTYRDPNRLLLEAGEDASYMTVLEHMVDPAAPPAVQQFGYKLMRLWKNHNIEFRDMGNNNIMTRRNPKTGRVEYVATDVGNFITKNTDKETKTWGRF